jgi:hypothetical protein
LPRTTAHHQSAAAAAAVLTTPPPTLHQPHATPAHRKYTFFKPKFIFYATYLSEKIGYWRYISIYRHLQRNPDNQLYPLFEYFENWCQDENRHGDFFTAVLKVRAGGGVVWCGVGPRRCGATAVAWPLRVERTAQAGGRPADTPTACTQHTIHPNLRCAPSL